MMRSLKHFFDFLKEFRGSKNLVSESDKLGFLRLSLVGIPVNLRSISEGHYDLIDKSKENDREKRGRD